MKREIKTPISDREIKSLHVGDMVFISGKIYCGRDAVLPKICRLIDEGNLSGIDLQGSVIFHTAVSPAGVGPTSSNKDEIEGCFHKLSQAGVKLHLGKGAIGEDTIAKLDQFNSAFAVIPPVTALLGNNTISKRLLAFPELGMEAFYELDVRGYPCIIAAVHKKSIY